MTEERVCEGCGEPYGESKFGYAICLVCQEQAIDAWMEGRVSQSPERDAVFDAVEKMNASDEPPSEEAKEAIRQAARKRRLGELG